MVYLWEAYVMDVNTNTRWIAANCDTCNDLDGFLKYILKYPETWTGSTGLTGFETDKTVAETAAAISKSGYDGVTDSGKLLPYEYAEGQQTNFHQVYGKVTDYVDEIRKYAGDAFVSTQLMRSAQAMNQALAGRRVSQRENIFNDLQLISDAEEYGFTMVKDANGDIDSAATIATNPKADRSASTMMRNFISGNWPDDVLEMKNVKPIYKKILSHNNAMASCQDCLNRLSTALPCTNTGAKVKRWAPSKHNYGRMLAKTKFSAYLTSF